MTNPLYPSLYQINTRVLLQERGQSLGRPATLDDLPDALLDGWAARGFDWLWPLGVWQTGPAGRRVAREAAGWGRREYQQYLPDLTDLDICGSPFAVQSYTVHTDFGGDDALARLRERLRRRGLRLLLDFVPNHCALDHPWTRGHPEYFIHGSPDDLAREPQNYCRIDTGRGTAVLAHGSDPYFPGWSDTLQLNYRHPGLRAAMAAELAGVAGRCDGVRCDMAMLVLPDVFAATWGAKALPADGAAPVDRPFWPEAIATARTRSAEFLLMAEAYWDLEWALQQQGFDYTYDKRLYDRLRGLNAPSVRGHLGASLDYQRRSVRFLENHDEPRAAAAFAADVHRAAAVVTFFVPGLRFFHEGQLEGRRVHVPMQVSRRPEERVDAAVQTFYTELLACLKRPEVRDGRWRLLACRPAWDGNPTWDRFLAFLWEGAGRRRLLGCVHYGPTRGQCYVNLGMTELRGKRYLLEDQLSAARYEREGDDLAGQGLFLDLPAWGYHLFTMVEIV